MVVNEQQAIGMMTESDADQSAVAQGYRSTPARIVERGDEFAIASMERQEEDFKRRAAETIQRVGEVCSARPA
jgi:hypothetical protein